MTPALTQETLAKAAAYLAARDKDLCTIFQRHGVPPLWDRKPGFSTLIRIILEQQVSLASADAMFRRLLSNIRPFTAERFLILGVFHLRSLGLTRQKAAYCINVAEVIDHQGFDLETLATMNDITVKERLMQIKGVGPWTAEIYLLIALGRPDVWPSGDIALVSALCRVKKLAEHPERQTITRIAETWRPFRSIAARMLWQDYLADKKR